MKRLLLIAYYFPPLGGAESIVTVKVLRGLAEAGWKCTVLTIDPAGALADKDPALAQLVPAGTRVVGARARETRYLREIPRLVWPKRWPDLNAFWQVAAVRRAIELCRERQFDVAYSRASPIAAALVGLELKRRAGLPWVAHFSDPWHGTVYHNDFWGRRGRSAFLHVERQVARHADLCTFASEPMLEDALERLGGVLPRERAVYLPHCYDPRLYPAKGERPDPQRSSRPLTLAHMGRFYANRSPLALFKAMANLRAGTRPNLAEELRLEFHGGGRPRWLLSAPAAKAVADQAAFLPASTYVESLRAMTLADALLLIDAPAAPGRPSLFFPSKLADYLGAGRPIVALTPRQGASASILRGLTPYVAPPDDLRAIEALIVRLAEDWKSERGLCGVDPASPAVSRFELSRTTESLAGALETAIRQAAEPRA